MTIQDLKPGSRVQLQNGTISYYPTDKKFIKY